MIYDRAFEYIARDNDSWIYSCQSARVVIYEISQCRLQGILVSWSYNNVGLQFLEIKILRKLRYKLCNG